VSAESSVHIVSFLLKLPSTECHAGAGIFLSGSLFFEILELQWLGDLEAGRDFGYGPTVAIRKPRSSLPVADPTSGLTIPFYLLITSVTILQGLITIDINPRPLFQTKSRLWLRLRPRKSLASKLGLPIFLAQISLQRGPDWQLTRA
jgi:hypothetical protein